AFGFLRKLAARVGRLSWRPVAVTAASGALVGCLVLLVAGVARPGHLVVILPGAGPDGSTVRFDPGALLDTPAMWGEKPLDQPSPLRSALASLLACTAPCGNRGVGPIRNSRNSANASTPAPLGGPLSRTWRPSAPRTRAHRPAGPFRCLLQGPRSPIVKPRR